MVTGVSGYLGSHVAKQLLEAGYRVRGTVRNLDNEAKVAPLKNLVPNAKSPLELVAADLTKDEGWKEAIEGCTGVMHVASPFPDMTTRTVPEEDLLVPAKEGTLRVLKAVAEQNGAVKRVVLTSSFAAVFGETAADPNKKYNEEDWTDSESPTLDPYTKSKTVAEKTAWDYIKELPDEQKFELAVVNPTLIMGPPLMEAHRSATSVNIMASIVNKTYPGVPKVQFPVCDVRDVARAHVKALTVPEAAGNRHIILTDCMWYKDIAASVAKEFRPQGYSIATAQLPYVVCWLAGLFNKGMRNTVLPRIGKTLAVDNKRMVEVLGVEPTAMDCTMQDMVYAMVDLGIVRRAKKYKQVGSHAEVPAVNGEVEEENKEGKQEEEKEKMEGEKELEPEDKEKQGTEEIKETKKEEEKVEDAAEKKETAEEKKEEKEEEKKEASEADK